MNYCEELFNLTEYNSSKTAILDLGSDKSITYEELKTNILRLATWLKNKDIHHGDIIALHMYNSIETVLLHMAIQFIGAVSCLLDPLIQPGNLSYYINDSQCCLLVSHLELKNIPTELTQSISVINSDDIKITNNTIPNQLTAQSIFSWNPEDVCSIYYTSGTTSTPKGVMLTPENHKNSLKIINTYWISDSIENRHLCFVPFSHGFGSIFLIFLTLNRGEQLYILRSFHPIKVIKAIENSGITHLYGVPSHYKQLLRYPGSDSSIKKLKVAFCAAAKLEHKVMLQWKKITGHYLVEGYGLIETATGVIYRIEQPPLATGHQGKIPDPTLIEIAIMNDKNQLIVNNEIGEIVIRGKSVMKGYQNKPEENERVFIDKWFRTGDQGYISEDKNLFITGRIKDIINIAGIKISPLEVEEVLDQHPAVNQSTVVAAEDNLYGEVVKAYVQKKPMMNITERELIRFASEHLMNFQVPKTIIFLENFPLNSMGKIDRKKLMKLTI